jgi:hypothetical protein
MSSQCSHFATLAPTNSDPYDSTTLGCRLKSHVRKTQNCKARQFSCRLRTFLDGSQFLLVPVDLLRRAHYGTFVQRRRAGGVCRIDVQAGAGLSASREVGAQETS